MLAQVFYKLMSMTEDDVELCGSNVTSSLILKVTQDLDEKRLQCSSYDELYLFDVTDTSGVISVVTTGNRNTMC